MVELLNRLKPVIGDWECSCRKNRKEDTIQITHKSYFPHSIVFSQRWRLASNQCTQVSTDSETYSNYMHQLSSDAKKKLQSGIH